MKRNAHVEPRDMSSMLSLVHAEQLLFSCVILTFCGKTVENLFRYSVSQVIGVQLGSFLTECVSSKVTVCNAVIVFMTAALACEWTDYMGKI